MGKRELVTSKSFQKSYKKIVTKKPFLKIFIEEALINLERNAFSIDLKTHKQVEIYMDFMLVRVDEIAE